MVKLDLPLRPWVPQWVGVVVLFVIILPVAMLNGAYTGTMQEVSSTLGVFSEDITMGYYASSVGMAVAYPIVTKIHSNLAPKTMLLVDLTLQAVLSFFCARTSSIDLIICISFVIGFLKAFVMLWFIIRIRPFFTPKNVRSEFYAYFYPLVFGGGQLSMALTAQLAYYYDWKYSYYFMMILLLLAIVLILAFFRYAPRQFDIPVREMHLRSMFIVAAALLMTMYVFSYGKVLDWFASDKICLYAVLVPLLLVLFFWHQKKLERPYISLEPLHSKKRLLGYFYMMLTMFFSTSSTLVTSYLTSVIRVDSVHANTLCLWLLPGFVVGAFICFWWFRLQRWRFRFLVAGGMSCFAVYFGVLYFGVSPDSTYEMLYLPTFFRGLGMMTLIIPFSLYAVEKLDPKHLLSNAFFLISFRSVLAPVIGLSFFSNMLYRFQQQGLHVLSETVTLADPVPSARYGQSLGSALAQGHGADEAARVAVSSLYTTLQQQSLLLSVKTVLGYLLLASILIAVVSCFIPFHRTVKIKIVRTGSDMV